MYQNIHPTPMNQYVPGNDIFQTRPDNLEYLMHFLAPRSTKGASKHRRDLINGEIAVLRDLMPLPEAARQRLSQLQIMSLACVYIRKCNFFSRLFGDQDIASDIGYEFSQTMTGFLLVTSRDGKLLYISENVTEYLGHSMVDMMTQGDSIYDIIDKRDHQLVQNQLTQGSFTHAGSPDNVSSTGMSQDSRTFFCRMNVARSFRRQAGFGDHKMMNVRGHFVTPTIREHYGNQPVFMAMCTPLITPDVKETAVQNSTNSYYSVHGLDMKYSELGHVGQHHLGYTETEMYQKSWYELLHPEDVHEAKDKHVQLIKSSHEMGCMLTVRLQHKLGHWVWTNIVMHIRQPFVCDNGEPAIVCINQVVDENEAHLYKIQSQLYSSHIARSPEFLGSQGTSPQHTITQVPSEGNTYPAPTYTSGQQAGGDVMYQVDLLATSSQIVSTGSVQRSGDRPSLVQQRSNIMYTDSSSEYSSGSPAERQHADNKQALRAGIINRLKRKMSESSTTSNCKPAKMMRVSTSDNQGDSPPGTGSVGYQASAVIANMSLFEGSGGGFSMGNADIQVIAPAHEGPLYQQLSTKKDIILGQKEGLIQVVASSELAHIFNKPPTPLTPDSLTSEYVSEFTPSTHTIDVTDCAIVPPSLLTPDASPMSCTVEEPSASPQPHTDPSLEYHTNLPALEDLTFFEDSTAKNSEKTKMSAMLHLPKTDNKRLPVIDVLSLEHMLNDLEDSPADVYALQPQSCEPFAPAPGDQIQDGTEQMNTPDNEELLNQVTSVLMEFVQNTADVDLDISQFMIMPQMPHLSSNPTSGVQSASAADDGLNGLSSLVEMSSAAISNELGFSLDDLHQLTSDLGMPPQTYGENDLASSLLTQNL